MVYLLASMVDLLNSMVDLLNSMVDLPNSMVDLPNTMVNLPNTMVDLPNTIVNLPYTMVNLPKTMVFFSYRFPFLLVFFVLFLPDSSHFSCFFQFIYLFKLYTWSLALIALLYLYCDQRRGTQ